MKFEKIIKEILEEQIDPITVGKNIITTLMNRFKSKPVQKGPLPFNEKNLSAELTKQGVSFPDVAMAQARLETGHFKSDVFKENNNLFGMKRAVHRTTLGQGNPGEYVYFKSIEESIIDYKLYQMQFVHEINSEEMYIKRICQSYSSNDNYEKLLLSVLESAREKIKWIKTKS